jgi:16S rRNA G966 N2-methylase RsmD
VSRATKTQAQQKIIERKLSELIPYKNNPRLHRPEQIKQIAKSINAYGFINPVLIDPTGEIIAGHARYEAAVLLGLETVPTLTIAHLTKAQRHAYRIADNKLAESGSWSIDQLKIEVDMILSLDASFDMTLTGFEERELNLSLDLAATNDKAPEPEVPEVGTTPVTKIGDMWDLGPHKLICSDATLSETYAKVMGNERAAMLFGDPPFNVKIAGHVSGKGRNKHREFVQGSGELTHAQFRKFLTDFMILGEQYGKPGSLHYVCMDWAHLADLLAAGTVAYDEYKNLCVWVKSQGGMGSLYRSQHEIVAVFKKAGAPHVNNIELGMHGRNRTNVWTYAGMNSFSKERDQALAMHPTVKPLALVRDAILDASNRGDIILDPFGGSGTTLLAADAVQRVARLIELDPLYCDVIIRRVEKALGLTAVLVATGQSFANVAAEREAAHV